MIKRGRTTTAQFRKAVKIGDRVTLTWDMGGADMSRDYVVVDILPPTYSVSQGREIILQNPARPGHIGALVRDLASDRTRLTFAD